MSANSNLHKAKSVKNDEFYTRLEDIENELKHYRGHFKDKVVYCNCDDPMVSNFFKYFLLNFKHLGLKRLITSCYRNIDAGKQTDGLSDKAVWLEYDGQGDDGVIPSLDNVVIHEFEGDGDFRSDESIALLKQADIVVTNPPFSLFREYIAQLIEYEKSFVVLGSMNAVTYKEIFPLLKDNKMWLGHKNGLMQFYLPEHAELKSGVIVDDFGNKVQKFGNIAWFTNMDIAKRHESLVLYREYNVDDYPNYDNYDAIDVSRIVDIPCDYDGLMGVPISIMDKYNPKQFEILGLIKGSDAFGATRTTLYENPVKHMSDGSYRKDGNVNAAPAIRVTDVSGYKSYYTADNVDGYLISIYARVLIKRIY